MRLARSRAARWAAVVALTAAALALLVLAIVTSRPTSLDPALTTPLALTAGFLPVGLFLVRQRPGYQLSWITWTIGVLAALAAANLAAAETSWALWAAQWTWWPPLGLLPLVLLHFPTTPDVGSRRRTLARAIVVNAALATALLAVAPLLGDGDALTQARVPSSAAARVAYLAVVGCSVATAVGLLAGAVAILRAALRAAPELRRQYLCLLPCAVLALTGLPLEAMGVDYALVPAILALPVGSGIAVVQYHYDDLDLRLARGFLRGFLIVVTMGIFGTALWTIGTALVHPSIPWWVCLAVTVAATALVPLQARTTRAVDRWLFGHRADPYHVLTVLGEQMQASPEPVSMLQNATSTIVETLTVPYARIVAVSQDERTVLAESGRPWGTPVSFPLQMPDRSLGNLEVSPRRIGEVFTAREAQLLGQIARQAAFAVRAHQLTADLQTAREVLVFSREEERLRLRRDLHDGLGPVLAGARMQLAAALALLPTGRSATLVTTVVKELGGAGRTVRELIEGLRPASLDLGLSAALEQTAAGIFAEMTYTVDAPPSIPPLPPAVEVAAYRIASEAMHNAMRHAGATHCVVVVRITPATLVLTVSDNGCGMRSVSGRGVGLASMAARAEELGGSFGISDADPGTCLTATLPTGHPEGPRSDRRTRGHR